MNKRTTIPPLLVALLGLGLIGCGRPTDTGQPSHPATIEAAAGTSHMHMDHGGGFDEDDDRPYEGWSTDSPEYKAMVERLKTDQTIPIPSPTLDPVTAEKPGPAPLHPTFTKDVAAIINTNCVGCHTGQGDVITLTDFRKVRQHAVDVARATLQRTMPPWGPEPGWGRFQGERRLSAVDIQTIQNWVKDGAPEGSGTAPKFQPPPEWRMGKPDIEVTLPTFTVPAKGPGWYHAFVVPLPIKQDVGVTCIDMDRGTHNVVHHAQFYLDTEHEGRKLCKGNLDEGYDAFGFYGAGFPTVGGLGSWQPGQFPIPLPDDAAWLVKQGTDLIVNIHFMSDGNEVKVAPKIALYLSKKAPATPSKTSSMFVGPLEIPAGDPAYVVRDHYVLPVPVTIYTVKPHAHLLAQGIKAVFTLPNGWVKPLVYVPHWNMDWQQAYHYQRPIRLPAGTRIDMEWVMDNSDKNPRQPTKPPKLVKFGEEPTDEMTILSLGMSVDNEDDRLTLWKSVRNRNYHCRVLSPQ